MKTWHDFSNQNPELAQLGKRLLFQSRIGLAYLATIRKDGAPRLHPVSLVMHNEHLYVFIPPNSPKCADLLRDGRCAMHAFPSPHDVAGEEFYFAGYTECIHDTSIRQVLVDDTKVLVEENEVLFEILLDRAMYKKLENPGTPEERPVYTKWQAKTT